MTVRILSRLGAGGLVAAMIACCLLMWIGIPLAWLYIGSQVAHSTQPSMGPTWWSRRGARGCGSS